MSKSRYKSIPLGIILVGFFLKSLGWMLLFPIFQTPDEVRHFDYIIHLAETKRFPLGPNLACPQDYYMQETADLADKAEFTRLVYRPSQKTEFIFSNDSLLTWAKNYVDNNSETVVHDFEEIYLFAYEPFYYVMNAFIYAAGRQAGLDIVARFFLLRVVSIILSLLSIGYLVKILKLLGLSAKVQFFVLAFVFFWPQLSMFFISIQPDVLSLFFVVFISYNLLLPERKDRTIVLGVLIGLLGLIKFQYFAAMFFSFLVVFFMKALIRRERPGLNILFAASLSVLISSAWVIHNYYFYHSIHPGNLLLSENTTSLTDKLNLFLMIFKGLTLRSFFAYFGWLDTPVSDIYYLILALLAAFGLWSFAATIFKQSRAFSQENKWCNLSDTFWNQLNLFLPLIVFVGLMLVIGIFMSPMVNSQGRLYFPFLAPLVLIFIYYPWVYLGGERKATLYQWAVLAFMGLLHIQSVFIIIDRYYG